MTLNIYVFEDQPAHAQYLIGQISAWCKEHRCAASITSYTNGDAVCEKMVKQADIFFFDIELEGDNGLLAARRVRQYSDQVPIVFITNFQDYVFDGYYVRAFRYLLKPISPTQCASCMKQAYDFSLSKQKKELLVCQKGCQTLIPINQILSVEAKGHYCDITTDQETITYLKNLRTLQKELPASHFIQTHRSFLANYRRICAMQDKFVRLDNGFTVPVSRHYRAVVQKALVTRIGVTR